MAKHPTRPAAFAAALVLLTAAGQVLGAPAAPSPAGQQTGDQQTGDGGVSSFYVWDKLIPDRPGTLLRQEPAPAQHLLAHAARVTRLLYSSRSGVGHGEPVVVSGELYLPTGQMPAAGWPIVAWSHGTTGFADVCAPSWRGRPERDTVYLDGWLAKGFAIVATDYEGLGTRGDHPYLLWRSEAHSILDSIRAVLSGDVGVRLDNSIVLVGQSQGAGAGLGAAWLAPTYAPELNVRVAVLTGLVTSIATARTHNKSATYSDPTRMDAGFAMLRFAGTDHALHPEAQLDSYLTPVGRIMLQTALHGCLHDLFDKARTLGLRDGRAMFSRPIAPIDADMESHFTLPDGRLTMPVFVGTGLADREAGTGGQYDAVHTMCAAGSHVDWMVYPGLTHGGAVNGSFRDSSAFVDKVFAGRLPPSNCASISVPGPIQNPRDGVPFNN